MKWCMKKFKGIAFQVGIHILRSFFFFCVCTFSFSIEVSIAGMDIHSVEDIKLRLDQVSVVAVTCLGITNPLLANKRFDICIMDEAGQTTLPVRFLVNLCSFINVRLQLENAFIGVTCACKKIQNGFEHVTY